MLKLWSVKKIHLLHLCPPHKNRTLWKNHQQHATGSCGSADNSRGTEGKVEDFAPAVITCSLNDWVVEDKLKVERDTKTGNSWVRYQFGKNFIKHGSHFFHDALKQTFPPKDSRQSIKNWNVYIHVCVSYAVVLYDIVRIVVIYRMKILSLSKYLKRSVSPFLSPHHFNYLLLISLSRLLLSSCLSI